MTEGSTAGDEGASPFESIDPRLNVFALANGMDLSKGENFRRLQGFSEGHERGILVEVDGDQTFQVSVLSWPSGSVEDRKQSRLGTGLSTRDLSLALSGAIDAANGL